MKFICDKDNLSKEVAIAQEIISSRNVLSILSNVYLETKGNTLILRASNLKIGFETEIPVDVTSEGSITVFCDKFLNILRALPSGEIEFELKKNNIFNIKPLFKKINFKLKSIDADKFPTIPETEEENYFLFPQNYLIEMISNTIFAISDDETRYFMNGVFIENVEDSLIMVASDGRRLSYISKKYDNTLKDLNSAIIPQKILNLLKKLLPGEGDVSVAIDEKYLFIRYGKYLFFSNLIEGKFPNYNKVIPDENKYKIVVQKALIESAVKRVSLLVEQKSRRVYLTVNNDIMMVGSDETEIGMAKEEISCKYEGPEVVIVLNCIYLLEPLNEMDTEYISIQFTSTDKTITIKAEPEKDYTHIIMPMQTK